MVMNCIKTKCFLLQKLLWEMLLKFLMTKDTFSAKEPLLF